MPTEPTKVNAPVHGELVKDGAPKPKTRQEQVRAFLDQRWPEIKAALPRYVDPMRYYRVVLTAVMRPPRQGSWGVLDCTQASILLCLINAAQLGLEPDGPQKHCFLIPFKESNQEQPTCTLVIGFQGLIKLARNSGEIKGVAARVVHKEDKFKYEFGLNERLYHKPSDAEDPGQVTHAYCVWRFPDGGYHFDVMTRRELDRIKNRKGEPRGISPWKTDEEEMQKKTVLRRSSKMVPNSIDMQRANAIDDAAEDGQVPTVLSLDGLDTEKPGPLAIEEQRETVESVLAQQQAKAESLEEVAARNRAARESRAKQQTAETPASTGEATGQPATPAATATPAAKLTSVQRRDIGVLAANKGVGMPEVLERYGLSSTADMTAPQFEDAKAWLAAMPDVTPDEPGSAG